jgi:hypothetical protein
MAVGQPYNAILATPVMTAAIGSSVDNEARSQTVASLIKSATRSALLVSPAKKCHPRRTAGDFSSLKCGFDANSRGAV